MQPCCVGLRVRRVGVFPLFPHPAPPPNPYVVRVSGFFAQMRITHDERVYTWGMTTTHDTQIDGPYLAHCPDDGGKWAIYCTHFDNDYNVFGVSILQDTNKARLAKWKKEPLMWCCVCQEEKEGK